MKDETVRLSTNQMAQLFNKEESNIRRHIINIFKDGELEKITTCKKYTLLMLNKKVSFYSLDIIIGVGYRVKSKNGIIFRKWLTRY